MPPKSPPHCQSSRPPKEPLYGSGPALALFLRRFSTANQRLIDPALIDQVLDQTSYRIIGKRRDDGRVQSEAALEAAGNVVFTASLTNVETACGRDACLTWIQAQHHLAQCHQVPAAI